MQLITQPNRVTCFPCALAMLAGKSLDEIISLIGHDGTEILWPDKTEPHNMRGFGETEIVEVAYELGWVLVPIDFSPLIQSMANVKPIPMYTQEQVEARLDKYLPGNVGIISGYTGVGKGHAVAWDGTSVYDPQGRIYRFEDADRPAFEISRFYMGIKFKGILLNQEA